MVLTTPKRAFGVCTKVILEFGEPSERAELLPLNTNNNAKLTKPIHCDNSTLFGFIFTVTNFTFLMILIGLNPNYMNRLLFVILILPFLLACATKLNTRKAEALKQELREMRSIDQIAANVKTGKYLSYPDDRWNAFKDSVFAANFRKAEYIFNKYGFPGYAKVGKEASTDFWLIVQHCDKHTDFQKRVLKAMDLEVKKNNANPKDYAYLFDRVKVNSGEKQMFGTQVTYEVATTGRAIPKLGLIDPENVDKLRKEYGLEPLKEYLNMMTNLHFNMNKKHYQNMGITEPNLY